MEWTHQSAGYRQGMYFSPTRLPTSTVLSSVTWRTTTTEAHQRTQRSQASCLAVSFSAHRTYITPWRIASATLPRHMPSCNASFVLLLAVLVVRATITHLVMRSFSYFLRAVLFLRGDERGLERFVDDEASMCRLDAEGMLSDRLLVHQG